MSDSRAFLFIPRVLDQFEFRGQSQVSRALTRGDRYIYIVPLTQERQ